MPGSQPGVLTPSPHPPFAYSVINIKGMAFVCKEKKNNKKPPFDVEVILLYKD